MLRFYHVFMRWKSKLSYFLMTFSLVYYIQIKFIVFIYKKRITPKETLHVVVLKGIHLERSWLFWDIWFQISHICKK